MADIRHNVTIKAAPEQVYAAVTTQAGLTGWWAQQTTAEPKVGFENLFTFGTFTNKLKVVELTPLKKVKWHCTASIEEWVDTTVSFELEAKGDRTLLRFSHAGWRAVTDTFAGSNYDWGRFLTSLKSYCETGKGTPA